jgi:hypothetical protein
VILDSGFFAVFFLGFVRFADVICGRAVFHPQLDLCVYWTGRSTASMVRLVSVCDRTPATQRLPRSTSRRQQVQVKLAGCCCSSGEIWHN